jgi:hypothetical protein
VHNAIIVMQGVLQPERRAGGISSRVPVTLVSAASTIGELVAEPSMMLSSALGSKYTGHARKFATFGLPVS